jgi:hypothetical protein
MTDLKTSRLELEIYQEDYSKSDKNFLRKSN